MKLAIYGWDSVILKVSSNCNDSMLFCVPKSITTKENYKFLLKSDYPLPFYMYSSMTDWHPEWDAVKSSALLGEDVCKTVEVFMLH